MTIPYYQDDAVTICHADCREILPQLPDNSVQCVVTSPPYWGLRKYAGNQGMVWGDDHCDHQWSSVRLQFHKGQVPDSKWKADVAVADAGNATMGTSCSLCGAWKGPLGLEPTPEDYVSHIVQIFREVRRVLRKDGVAFLNIGDSYASGKGTCFNPGGGSNSLEGHAHLKEKGAYPLNRGNKSTLESQGLKPKDLCLIPFRLAIALQEDGWWVRSIIHWVKTNPMPESVRDRPTDAVEYILMLTKAGKYYWDADAVKEQSINPNARPHGRYPRPGIDTHGGNQGSGEIPFNGSDRNIRNAWIIPTQPYAEAHFAVFPEEIPHRCILAASKQGDVVCDPFSGAGTTLKVAKELGRKAIGIDTSEEYCDMAIKRIPQGALLTT